LVLSEFLKEILLSTLGVGATFLGSGATLAGFLFFGFPSKGRGVRFWGSREDGAGMAIGAKINDECLTV
jgi:hypothetical protein